jgi:uncharacterized protein (TIGR02246 family)
MGAVDEIRATIESQAGAWNSGDLPGFLEHVSDDVIYVTSGGILRGREALYEAYRGDWRDSPGGELAVSVEEILDHGNSATVVVRFWLSASRDDRAGWSLLTFVKEPGGWKLAADATLRSR